MCNDWPDSEMEEDGEETETGAEEEDRDECELDTVLTEHSETDLRLE